MAKKKATPKKKTVVKAAFTFPKVKGIAIPKNLALVADKFYDIRLQRYAADKYAAELKKQESKIQEHLINNVKKGSQTGVRGKVCSVYVENAEKYNVVNWNKFWEYAKRRNKPELFQRRINEAAIKEIIADGKKVPGTQKIQIPKLHVSKV